MQDSEPGPQPNRWRPGFVMNAAKIAVKGVSKSFRGKDGVLHVLDDVDLRVDDGARLWVDDQLILDAWTHETGRELTADLDLQAGTHALRLEYFDRSGDAEARLWWETRPAP